MRTDGSEKAKTTSIYSFALFILLILLLGACTSQTTTPSLPPPTATQIPEPTPSPTVVPTLASLPDVGVVNNWTPVEMDGSYSRFVHTDPELELHVVRVETDDPEIGVVTALGQIGVDISALSLLGTIPDPRWSITSYDQENGQGLSLVALAFDGAIEVLIMTGDLSFTTSPSAWAFQSYPPEYLLRPIRWGESDVYDYEKFPARPMAASPSPFYFEEEPAEAMVKALFEQHPSIQDLDDFLEQTQTQAFIVIQNDAILYEKYFNGASRDTIVTSFSVAKSWNSALIGAAIDDGFIQSVDDPITDYLPELAERDPAFAGITIRDLLRMSSGIKYQGTGEIDGDDSLTYYYPDLRKLALEETTVIVPPGSYFLYNNYHPLLLGMILERATGMPVAAYLEAKIWQPIGMEFDGSWSLDSETSGFEKMESGINGRAIDFAKFGRLYLNNGNWDGTQVLPEDWVAQSTRPEASIGSSDYYGLMWLGRRRGESNYDYFAEGHYGQEIYVSPHKNLIIVRNGEAEGGQRWPNIFYRFASDIELEADG